MSNLSVLHLHVFDEKLDLDGFQAPYIQLYPKLSPLTKASMSPSFFPLLRVLLSVTQIKHLDLSLIRSFILSVKIWESIMLPPVKKLPMVYSLLYDKTELLRLTICSTTCPHLIFLNLEHLQPIFQAMGTSHSENALYDKHLQFGAFFFLPFGIW